MYDTIVRMAQPFSLRYMLVDGQGTSVRWMVMPPPMRYTEVRMQKITQELLTDLDKRNRRFLTKLRRKRDDSRCVTNQNSGFIG